MVREVLEDWLSFLGGRPKQVIFAVSPADKPPPIYQELLAEGLIDELVYVDLRGRSVGETDAEGIRVAIEAAKTDWVLLAKLDTLPYRKGHENWLDEVMQTVQKYNCFGFTGSFPSPDMQSLEPGYSKTQKFSNNFSIFRGTEWIEVIDSYVGKNFDGAVAKNALYTKESLRFANEAAIESFLEKNQRYMLVRWETPEWTVFHVNVWGEQLRQIRDRYLARKDISSFLNTGRPQLIGFHPWDLYYGYPKPPLLERFKIFVGRWRRIIFRNQ
ncbi:hypothetical protein Osc7112_0011 [Oscillatoria nigro-viridis PCC 7112]|uniref:Glycosyltransferase 2-like domain-containing protein n=2 Tax=Phormidium nigroviride TaxID=482564 RepID=K9VAF9_9CYAN|nr:hypothetical protein Osc7112_0011 [Oscillatoria nigro-viridis PCC 7112]